VVAAGIRKAHIKVPVIRRKNMQVCLNQLAPPPFNLKKAVDTTRGWRNV
jgi:hypothetical protein